MSQDTIYALSSGHGRSAVAVVRVSGPRVRTIVERLTGTIPPVRQACYRAIRQPMSGEVIDYGIVLYFAAPSSATGEDIVEFHVHGGRAVLRALYNALDAFDLCRPAEPGEFARRGFENGKLDLTAAEGIADIIDAETEAQRRQAQRQAGGALAKLYDGWRHQLIEAQALVEAAIDFSDEGDVGDKAYIGADEICRLLQADICEHLASADRGEIVRSGFHVVIAGPPNAGKSSLLNALARRDAAIVSDEAGTTRDVIEVHMDLDGLPVIINDTAGVRETEIAVEQEGIRRTMDRAQKADLILWVQDVTSPEEPTDDILSAGQVLIVQNKSDLLRTPSDRDRSGQIRIAALHGTGVPDLIDLIVSCARERIGDVDDLMPTNARHRRHLEIAVRDLDRFQNGDKAELELRAEDLRLAATAIGRLTGRIDVEDILDEIFSRFCVGK